jgi:hypothetical protein
MKILKMVQDGRIRAEDGIRLLEALNQRQVVELPSPPAQPPLPIGAGRFIRIRVTDTLTGKPRVNVRLPVGLINAGMKMGARLTPEIQGMDSQQIMQAIRSGETGTIVDIIHDEDHEHIEVMIE